MLDLVPLARSGREMADRDLKAVVGEALQLGRPQAHAVAVAAAAVGGDLQGRSVRVGDEPSCYHQLRIDETANAAVSLVIPTLTKPLLAPMS